MIFEQLMKIEKEGEPVNSTCDIFQEEYKLNHSKTQVGSFKVYGSDICIDCRNYKKLRENRRFLDEYIDITESVANMKDFLQYRDKDPIFEEVKKTGGIGIPFFVAEDGQKTFDLNEALSWIGQGPVTQNEIER